MAIAAVTVYLLQVMESSVVVTPSHASCWQWSQKGSSLVLRSTLTVFTYLQCTQVLAN